MEFVISEGVHTYSDGPSFGSEIARATSAADAAILAAAHLLRYPEDVVHIERMDKS